MKVVQRNKFRKTRSWKKKMNDRQEEKKKSEKTDWKTETDDVLTLRDGDPDRDYDNDSTYPDRTNFQHRYSTEYTLDHLLSESKENVYTPAHGTTHTAAVSVDSNAGNGGMSNNNADNEYMFLPLKNAMSSSSTQSQPLSQVNDGVGHSRSTGTITTPPPLRSGDFASDFGGGDDHEEKAMITEVPKQSTTMTTMAVATATAAAAMTLKTKTKTKQ
ncbi:hypothetical protein RFI_26826, partial [Reticulomyxa filosa]